MNRGKVAKIQAILLEIGKHARGRRARELEAIAEALGRKLAKRGKEPTWVRTQDPVLSPPLSIPSHSKDMKAGTVRSIVDILLSDCDDWEQYFVDGGHGDDHND